MPTNHRVNEDTFWRNYFYRVFLLKQMSDRGEDIKQSHGWTSSRSSSGEGPDEMTTTDDVNQNEITNQPASTTTTTAPEATTTTSTKIRAQELESSESRKLVAEADDLKSRLKELNIGSFDDGGASDG